jgi:tetratricopeptide (TPR) repeat protein
VSSLEEALRLEPGALRLHQPLATAYQALGEPAKAQESLRRYSIDGTEPAVPDPAADALGDKVAASKVLLRRGQRAGRSGRFDQAEKAFRAAVAADPTNAEALANLGISLANLDRIEEAQNHLEQALRMDPSIAVAHLSLGVLHDRQGRDAAAIEQYEAALTHDRDYIQAYVYLADALMRQGDALRAAARYAEALGKSPDSMRMRYSLAMAYVKGHRLGDARKTLEDGLAAQPGNQVFINALARILATAPDRRLRDGPRALDLARKLFEVARVPDVGQTYAMALAENGRFEEAAKLQEETIIAFERSGAAVSGKFLADNLDRYRRREPARAGWAADDPVFAPRSPAARRVS